MIILVLFFILINPAQAYKSGDAIIIKRKAPRKKALLDHKFVFIQEGAAFKPSSKFEAGSSKQRQTSNTNLVSFSTPNKTTVIQKTTIQEEVTNNSNHTASSLQPQTSSLVNIYEETNWNDYATETEESLGVRAWITKLQN